MSNDDFYAAAAQKRLNVLNAERLRIQQNLAVSVSDGDQYGASQEIQELANLEAEQANLLALAQREVARQNPPAPIPQTPEELRVKPAEKMTWQDGLDVATNGSKYGKGLDFNDPNVQRGYAEVMRRRRAGENQS